MSSIFYFGYLFWAYPTSFLIPKLPVGKYVAINTVIWGLVVALTAVCTNFGGLAALRFLLGVVESTITPAFVFITGTYYTRDEIPLRTGTWFAGNSFGGLVASLLAYAIGRIDNQIQPWQFLFIVSMSRCCTKPSTHRLADLWNRYRPLGLHPILHPPRRHQLLPLPHRGRENVRQRPCRARRDR